MRYLKRFGLIISAIILSVSAMAVGAQAQRHYRPVIVRSHFFWGMPYYYGNPYYWEANQRYYDRKDVRDKDNKLNKDTAKFNSDGTLTPKEQEKLAKDREKYDKAVDRLHDDRYYR